ncbi:magnesium/cobalt transporter CorA [Brumimicrobium salinarum]|nr:magnesium/cobalt transporter CorA [Brumimicrobium salinarum]
MAKKLKFKKQQNKKQSQKINKAGMAPGQFIFTGEQKTEKTLIQLMTYNNEQIVEESFNTIDKALTAIDQSQKTAWLNIIGLHEVEITKKIVEHFNFHKLSGEDILSVGQRPKLDDYEHYVHLVARMFHLEQNDLVDEQITILFKEGILITFQEREEDAFELIRTRMKEGKGLIRSKKTDYLAYALLDYMVDHYFIAIEHFGNSLEDIEVELLSEVSDDMLPLLHHKRREIAYLRRSVFPLREAISKFEKLEKPFMSTEIKVFIRDVYDHTIHVMEMVTVYKDSVGSLLELYMSIISNRMNKIMKVLTIVSTIFIPLTFVAGVYGMNFSNMPELTYKNGYFITLFGMAVLTLLMIFYFKRKKWL